MTREQINLILADKLVQENARLASKISMDLVVEAMSLMTPDKCEQALAQHTLSAIVGAYEDGQRVYAAMEDRYENEPADPILRSAYCAGYESAM
jgi:hypothetical protein